MCGDQGGYLAVHWRANAAVGYPARGMDVWIFCGALVSCVVANDVYTRGRAH